MLALGMLTQASAPAGAVDPTAHDWKVSRAWRLATAKDIPAPVQRAAIDPATGVAYLATLAQLYEVRDGRARAVTKRPHHDARLLLAPEGGMYAWLIPDEASERLFFARLVDISGEHLADLEMKKAPYGFGGLYLGTRGRLVVTVSALDDWQGSGGRFLYGFWSRDGSLLGTVLRPEREIGIVAADGRAFLLLGSKEALAFSPTGELLWRLDGRYRKAAIAADGTIALLNPAGREEIDHVHVVRGSGAPAVVTMPTPVHKLRLTPDGSAAVVTGSAGRYFFLDPAKGRFDEGVRLPFDAALFISDVEFVDRDTIAVGVLERHGEPPRHSWPRGALIVVDRKGDITYRSRHQIREPYSSRPAVDVSFGVPKLVGFTLDEVMLVGVGH
jgi:hypothetical protein